MLKLLAQAEAELPELLKWLDGWTSLDVDYEPPRVERLWRPFHEDHRLYLHRIHPCETALFHPHPWPSAIKVVTGGYEMAVGYGPGGRPPRIAATIQLAPGSSYEMLDPDGWHHVLPTVETLSIMVTGPKWDRWSPGPPPDKKLWPLTEFGFRMLLQDFQSFYPG